MVVTALPWPLAIPLPALPLPPDQGQPGFRFRWGQALCRFPHPCRFLLRPLVLQLSAPFKGVDTWWGPCQTQPHFLGHCRALAFFIEQHFLEGPGFQSPQEPLGAIPILFTYYPYRLSRAVITVPK